MADDALIDLKALTADIVASFVGGNNISASELPTLISGVFGALEHLGDEPAGAAEAPTAMPTAAQIRRTITPDAIRCLDCGGAFKTLRRHLGSAHGLTPHQYRAKYGLPVNYPLVSETTSKVRSEHAISIGLGRKAGRKARKGASRPRVPKTSSQ